MKGLGWRIGVVLFTVLFSVYLLIPTLLKFKYGKSIPRTPKPDDPWYVHVLPAEVLKLGLDLSGGLHLVLGVDFNEVMQDAASKVKNQIIDVADREKIAGVTAEVTGENKVRVKFPDEATWKKLDTSIGRELGTMVDFDGQSANDATLRITPSWEQEVRKRAIDQSLETLRNRIDEFGIAEPILQRQGDDKIMLQFPGVQETGRLKEIISRTAKLSFQIVRSGPEEPQGPPTPEQLQKMVDEFIKSKNLKLDANNSIAQHTKDLNAFVKGKIPDGTEIIFHKRVNVNTKEAEYLPYLLTRDALVTGEDLQDAYVAFNNETQDPEVHFQLTPVGAQKFEKATGENIRKYMAIVLDGNVHSAPVIRNRFPGGRAMIQMGDRGRNQNDVYNEARDTSLVLRSGALPARLEFLEERVVGPSLGADAIKSGMLSLAVGLGLVFVFMTLYYKTSGMIANVALFLNGVFIFAAMAAFEGTLSLPGLAGITLTLGMAVDANVLIFEHMREELRSGKSFNFAVIEGYRRAFTAIFDSHVTTIIAGIILLSFGYGPIRGFAVTLLIGLLASLYTSVFVTRVLYDLFVVSKNREISV